MGLWVCIGSRTWPSIPSLGTPDLAAQCCTTDLGSEQKYFIPAVTTDQSDSKQQGDPLRLLHATRRKVNISPFPWLA